MVVAIDFIPYIRAESARFAAALAAADPAARVPTCPDWNAADLLWHLTEVQLFWGAIVRDRLDDPAVADAAAPARPDDFAALLALFGGATDALIDTLTNTAGDTEVWTWASDHSVNFVRRRQAHEALIHRLDAELVGGDVTAIDPVLAVDGVDEALVIVHGELAEWATFTPDGTIGTVEATDADARWRVALGRFVGTGPDSGKQYDMDSLTVVAAEPATPVAFTVRGRGGDLDAWLWGRGGADSLEVDGDRDAFRRLELIVARGVD
jgi:uncharacterized protein (TIGR03083 family)